MVSARIVTLAALACAVPALVSCALQGESVDRRIELQLDEYRAGCLSAARPAYSTEHTDCVLARYQERQRQLERMRTAVVPAPEAAPPTPAAAPDWGPRPDFMI